MLVEPLKTKNAQLVIMLTATTTNIPDINATNKQDYATTNNGNSTKYHKNSIINICQSFPIAHGL
jgi:hypothetical protein